ncbi:MAG: Gfo/Idh/MocA family oxidoreductase [Planctomycetales bacterium]|nr:Gfo/Idh/MocA family oxidoreductase [Planctomycetales bacterium]
MSDAENRGGSSTPRVAIIGCGAIAERYHLPALAKLPGCSAKAVLVDPHMQRAREMADAFGVPDAVGDYRDVIADVDCAVLAVPHHLHYPLAMDFLSSGVHVLSEKPLAGSVAEANEMVEEARSRRVVLCVNQTRRLFPTYAAIHKILASGELGHPVSIRYLDGKQFHWPTASGFYFRQQPPRGVLFDKGIHGLDAICWWLGGKPEVVSSQNDSYGGTESVAHVRLRHGQCDVEVRLSWLSQLDNTYRIECSNGVIEGGIENWDVFKVTTAGGHRETRRLGADERSYDDFGVRMLGDFFAAAANGSKPLVPAEETIDAIRLIDECYQQATRFDMPWCDTWSKTNEQ